MATHIAKLDEYLVRVARPDDAPSDSYVIYQMYPKGTFYCPVKRYDDFSKYLSNVEPGNLHLAMDLASARGHSLVFDLDITFLSPNSVGLPRETRGLMTAYFRTEFTGILKSYLSPLLKHYTAIVTARSDHKGGLHVHLPEVCIGYDDYVELCSRMHREANVSIEKLDAMVRLDTVANFSLVKCSKPQGEPYEPVLVYYSDEKNQYFLNVESVRTAVSPSDRFWREFQTLKKKFKQPKNKTCSFFRKLLLFDQVADVRRLLYEAMSPVVTVYKPNYYVYYPTAVTPIEPSSLLFSSSTYPGDNNDGLLSTFEIDLATFVYNDSISYRIRKNVQELQMGEKEWLKSFRYLESNVHSLSCFKSKNKALRLWYKRLVEKYASPVDSQVLVPFLRSDDVVYPDVLLFRNVEVRLKQNNCNFRNVANPLRVIMTRNRCYFFLPMFYALVNHLKLSSDVLIVHLRPLFERAEDGNEEEEEEEEEQVQKTEKAPKTLALRLLDKLAKISPKIIETVASEFTFDTILYCGSNAESKAGCTTTTLKDKITDVLLEMKGYLLFVTSVDQLADTIEKIQRRHYPVMTANIRHSCKKAQTFHWNPTSECWQLMDKESNVERFIAYVWTNILSFMRSQKDEREYNEWYKRVGKKLSPKTIADGILTETNVARKIVEMDRHKWHVRTGDGILDLLTGHVGATVPEFYMSERKLSVSLNRRQLMILGDLEPELVRVYRQLTDRRFFQKYLKALFENVTDDLLETLLRLAGYVEVSSSSWTRDCALSAYRFYVHLCKYTSFEYSRLMYTMDVIASLLVATNYARKFFILKGVTKNGKSKFFQMISRVFGGYSYAARSVNLQKNHASQGLGAMPELASSLFGCRVVTVEELSGKLNENLIKEITGNSTTSFRNLFEQNSGGIPTAKILASTNTLPECTATDAFRDRVVAFPFDAKFSSDAGRLTTAERVLEEKYVLETGDSVVEDSHVGFFVLAYLHFALNRNDEDGLLDYRSEPEALMEFKEEILLNTDIYEQFKQYVDVQLVPHSHHSTVIDDLKSAIRYFLKQTKNTSIQESDLIVRFDEEFGHLKKTMFPDFFSFQEEHLSYAGSASASLLERDYGSIACRYSSSVSCKETEGDEKEQEKDFENNDDGTPPTKRTKWDEEGEQMREEDRTKGTFYYDTVVIRNLGRIVKTNNI